MFDNKKLIKAIEKFKNGDTSAFNHIYEQTNRLIYYTIYPIVKDHALAEDIMQNVFIKIYENIDSYTERNSPKAWIVTIARNLAINEYNHKKREVIVDIDTIDYLDNTEETKETPLIDLAEEHLEEDEFIIVMLCICEGYKRREVAEITGLSTSGVAWKLHNALEKLKSITEGGAIDENK